MTKEQVDAHNLKVKAKPKADAAVQGAQSSPPVGEQLASVSRPQYETWLENQLAGHGVIGMEREYHWCRGRKYRSDLAFPELRIIVEIDGGAHRTKKVFGADIIKSQQALLQDWTLIRVSTKQVRDGSACTLIRQVISMRVAQSAPF
jgi:very-short-patch-repair endonuclease